jgi:hypothetical protein
MPGPPDTMVVVAALLFLSGGGALGVALGATLNVLTGGQARGAIPACAALGGALGVVMMLAVPTPELTSFLSRFGGAPTEEETQRVLKDHYPDDYAQVQATERTLTATGASQAQINAALHHQMLTLMQRQMPLASDENALAYLAVARDEYDFMKSNPDLCYRVTMQPSADTEAELVNAMPGYMREREERLELKLLEQTATAPQAPKPSKDLDGKLKMWAWDAVSGLSSDERAALQQGGELGGKAACHAVGDMLEMISWSGSDAVEAYKALSAKGFDRMSDVEQTPSVQLSGVSSTTGSP